MTGSLPRTIQNFIAETIRCCQLIEGFQSAESGCSYQCLSMGYVHGDWLSLISIGVRRMLESADFGDLPALAFGYRENGYNRLVSTKVGSGFGI